MNKKAIICLLSLFFVALCSWADNKQTVTINGETVEKAVARITFNGDLVNLSFDDGTVMESIDMGNLVITFSKATGDDTAIDLLQVFSYSKLVGNQLIVGNIQEKAPIAIYDANGMCCLTTVASSSSQNIDISNLKGGAYILRVDKQVIKFVKR